MTKTELKSLIGKDVTVHFKDGTTLTGKLEYENIPYITAKGHFKEEWYFRIENLRFKIGEVKKALPMMSAYFQCSGCGTGKTASTLTALRGYL